MSTPKPFWQTLKWILSVLMVLLFYLERIPLANISLHDPIIQGSAIPLSEIAGYLLQGTLLALNMVLIPMFIFIAAYLTQKSTIKEIYQSLLPAFITYCAFQLINTIPLWLEGRFSWQALLLFPLDGVWFILAVPVWQGLSLCLSAFSGHRIFKVALFSLSLCGGFWAFYSGFPDTGFALIIGYYPIFYLGRQVSHGLITRWRAIPLRYFSGFFLGVLFLLISSCLGLPIGESLMEISKFSPKTALLNYLLFMVFSILLGMILIYLIRYSTLLEKVAPKALGIYLIHPIICTSILAVLHQYGISMDLLLAIGLTLMTVVIALGLASILPFRWLLSPKFS